MGRALGGEVFSSRVRRGRAPLRVALVVAVVGSSALWPTTVRAADDGLKQIAGCPNGKPQPGSSNPTFYSNNHRVITTQGGRVIVVYDGHGSGQQIRWRDRGGSWQGALGGYVPGDFPNDRTASLAVFNSGGSQEALLVWSGYAVASTDGVEFSSTIQMLRLTNLDGSGGPSIGPVRTLEGAGTNMRLDFAVHGGRGALVWTRRSGSGFEVVTAWLSSLDAATPTLVDRTVLYSDAHEDATATLVPSSAGMRAVVANAGQLEVWTNAGGASWTKGPASENVSSSARPSAAVVGGDILAAAESGSSVRVYNLSGGSGDGSFSGYRQPSIASNGSRAWVFMVDSSDDVVSYELAGGSWGNERAEIEGQGGLAWPNALRDVDDGKLRVLVDGADCSERNRNPVLYYERSASGTAPPPSGGVSLSVGDVSVIEANRTAVTARFRLSLSEESSDDVTVRYQTTDGTAHAGSDYTAKSGTTTFAAGVTAKTVSVRVRGDRATESNEDFFLDLSNPGGATLSDARGTATIVDNDGARTTASVTVRRLARRLRISGTVSPALVGRRVTATLWRRRHGRFVKVAARSPVLRATLSASGSRDVSRYKALVRRPRRGRCKVVTKVARRRSLRGSKAVRYFKC
jgi:hypothetical protein